jgi:4'-phosphopantetheinyl transferase
MLVKYFTACTRDVTPPDLHPKTRVLYLPFSRDTGMLRHFAAIISEEERQRSRRFSRAEDASRFVQRRAFHRFCGAVAVGKGRDPSAVYFNQETSGRPYLAEALEHEFSFSSCQSGALGAWSSAHSIGVDIEDRTRKVNALDLAIGYFTETEAEAIRTSRGRNRTDTFLQLWCAKEAALKSIGQGLPGGLDIFAFDLKPSLEVTRSPRAHGGPELYSVFRLEGTGACGILITRQQK